MPERSIVEPVFRKPRQQALMHAHALIIVEFSAKLH
jgi:hypothetical protein